MAREQGTGWNPGDPIGYVREGIPEFEIPAYEGERYEALVPDTLDLQERAALAINGLTGPTDARADHEIYFIVDFFQNPPVMTHDFSDVNVVKFMEALPLLRLITGSDLNSQVDRSWMESALRCIGPDGLHHIPLRGRPWLAVDLQRWATDLRVGPHWEVATLSGEPVTQLGGGMNAHLIAAMTAYYLRDGNPMWTQTVEHMIRGSLRSQEGEAFSAGRGFDAFGAGKAANKLTKYYQVTGYRPALGLAAQYAAHLRDGACYFGPDGSFLYDAETGARLGFRGAHFHAHTVCLLGMLEYAVIAGNQEMMEFVRNAYEYGKTHGYPLVGFFPENVLPHFPTSETCEVADMIVLALKLSEAGVGDYWDDADRWVRNQFAENQLTRTDWVDRMFRPQRHGSMRATPVDFNECIDRVAERNLGAFAGWPSISDWLYKIGIQHCCTGNAATAIYHIWERILTYVSGELRVNLLMNRASSWADVDSHIPYVGRVDVKVKQPVGLSVRIPEWVRSDEMRVVVNGADRRVGWAGRCADVGPVQPGHTVSITFPIDERIETLYADREYTLVLKGNDVVAIDPPGRFCPLYQRAHYRANGTRWRKVQRFVSDETIYW